MQEERITLVLVHHVRKRKYDVDVPLDISANDLIISLNEGYRLGMDTGDLASCFLRAERPICLLHGNKQLADFGLSNGTTIHITE